VVADTLAAVPDRCPESLADIDAMDALARRSAHSFAAHRSRG